MQRRPAQERVEDRARQETRQKLVSQQVKRKNLRDRERVDGAHDLVLDALEPALVAALDLEDVEEPVQTEDAPETEDITETEE